MLTSYSRIWNQTKEKEERLGTLSIPRGKDGFPVKVVHSGDICVVPKLADTSTSDTICDRAHPLVLPVPVYPSALYRVAISPKTQADSTKISPTLLPTPAAGDTIKKCRNSMSTRKSSRLH